MNNRGKGNRSPRRSVDPRTARITRYQLRLLKELTALPTMAKTWRSRMKNILIETADVIDVAFLYVLSPGEDGRDRLELFWLREPSASARTAAEAMIARRRRKDTPRPAPASVAHAVARPGSSSAAGADRNIRLYTTTCRREAPRAAGSVGMGLFGKGRRSALDRVAVDSTLTAAATIIGSVKALSAYTLDVERFATRDALTGLYNQISFWDLLEYETSRSSRQQYRFSLLVIDLDNFKTINDTFGHEIGDAVLRDFSRILKNAVRSGDIPVRYAGDQFAAILPVCDELQACTVARRIIESLRDHSFRLANGSTIKGTVSIGVAVYPDHAREARDLFLLADNMLSQAKSCGKDRLIIPGEHDDVQALKSMGEKSLLILEALAQGRIIPYFQPIMNILDGKVEAYEVLTRIVLPDRVINAAEFIETAEGMGAIGRIDYQLFEHALAKVRETKYTGNLFINLSPRALMIEEFMPTIRRMMRDYGLDPTKLIFEITERDTVKNLKLIDKFIRELKHDGFRFAIDDFGSGYSSFQYIKTFSIDFLKVDGEFIRHLAGAGSVEKHIVTSIAALAANLGIKTIAEYVESQEILGEVRLAGINYAQGYFIRRPSPDLF